MFAMCDDGPQHFRHRHNCWRALGATTALAALTLTLAGCGGSGPQPGANAEAGSAAAAAAATAVSPAKAADGKKVLRIAFPVQESGFDPQVVHDLYSAIVVEGIFDTVLTYDYLADPVKVVPKISTDMPLIEDDGKRYTIRLKPGTYFAPHEVFGSEKRELTAEDVAYTFKRHYDDSIRPVWRFLIDGKIVGLNEWYEAGKKAGKLDWDAKVPGLEVLDRYTLRIQLTRPDYNFNYVLAHAGMAIVAREVVERYPDDVNSHPVGSSAYYLKEWVRGQRMVLERNPNWSGGTWDFKPSGTDPYDEQIVKDMQGKPLGQIDRVEIYVIEEEQSRWLAFKSNELDFINMPGNFAPQALPGGKLAPDLAAAGVRLQQMIDPEYTYMYFQWNDPVWGGNELHKVALRRAVAMAINRDEEIEVIRMGQAVKADFLVPPGVVGYRPDYASSITYNPALANALLDHFGYKRGADGYRNQPNGRPFSLRHTSTPAASSRQFDELYKKNLDAIGIRYEPEKEKFADSLKREKRCQLQSRGGAWIADYPDGDNFLQLLYSKNIGESNSSCYSSPAFDALYERSVLLPDGPERDALFLEMQQQFEADTPWAMGVSRMRNQMIHPWVVGYKKHPVLLAEWMYLDLKTNAKGN